MREKEHVEDRSLERDRAFVCLAIISDVSILSQDSCNDPREGRGCPALLKRAPGKKFSRISLLIDGGWEASFQGGGGIIPLHGASLPIKIPPCPPCFRARWWSVLQEGPSVLLDFPHTDIAHDPWFRGGLPMGGGEFPAWAPSDPFEHAPDQWSTRMNSVASGSHVGYNGGTFRPLLSTSRVKE